MEKAHYLCHPCPPEFKPAGMVRRANLIKIPQLMAHNRKLQGAKARGVNYETKVQDHLSSLLPDTYVASPWFEFTSAENPRPRLCQADGFSIDIARGEILLVEVKLKHCALAWWQLHHLYAPVVQWLWPGWTIKTVEVVKWFDPATRTPDSPRLRSDLAAVQPGEFAVHIWG